MKFQLAALALIIFASQSFASTEAKTCKIHLTFKSFYDVPQDKLSYWRGLILKKLKSKPDFVVTTSAEEAEFKAFIRVDSYWDHHSGESVAAIDVDVSKDRVLLFEHYHYGKPARTDRGALASKNIKLATDSLFRKSLKSCSYLRSLN